MNGLFGSVIVGVFTIASLSITAVVAVPRVSTPVGRLCKAASRGDLAGVKKELAQGINVNTRHSNGTTAIYWAAYGGHDEVVKFLIGKGADVNVKESRDSRTPLHEAAHRGYQKIVKMLLDHKAKVDARDYQRQTPLHLAADGGQVAISKMLIERGADVNAKNTGSFTPLHRAAQRGRLEVIKLLISNGANVNARMMYGHTPLDLASDTAIADLLRQHGGKKMAVPYRGGPR